MFRKFWLLAMISLMAMPTMAVVAQDDGGSNAMDDDMMSDAAMSADATEYGQVLVVSAAFGVYLRADGNGYAEGGGEIIGREPYGNSVVTVDPDDHVAPVGFGCAGNFTYVDIDIANEDNDLGWICSDHLSTLAELAPMTDEIALDEEMAPDVGMALDEEMVLIELMAMVDEMATVETMVMADDTAMDTMTYGETLYVTAADGVNLRADGNGYAEGGGEVIGTEQYGNSVAIVDSAGHVAPVGFGCAGDFTFVDIDIANQNNALGWICSDYLSADAPAAMMAVEEDASNGGSDSAGENGDA